MHRPEVFRVLADACSLRWLHLRGTLLLFGGRLLGDEFMKLAGRFDLRQARRQPRSGGALHRIHTR
ncbi:MAG: hypothetical protein ACK5PW_10380 [Burkholderiales bacterium]